MQSFQWMLHPGYLYALAPPGTYLWTVIVFSNNGWCRRATGLRGVVLSKSLVLTSSGKICIGDDYT